MRILLRLSNVKTKLILPGLFGFSILLAMIISPVIVIAQTPPMSTPSPTPASSSTGNDTEHTIEITSLQDGQMVPVGELTIQGTSSDITPMQNATGSGSGGATDYSNWTFAYTPDYQTITEGTNELTAKISCFDVGPTPISKYNSVNITGLPSPDTFAAPVPIPSTTG